MNSTDPNLPLLESVAAALGPLRQRFVFVGGCATGLLVTDDAAAPARVTRDVDVIVEVLSLLEYHQLERKLTESGFKRDPRSDAPVCRWLVGDCVLDVMPTDERILGFSNRWYAEAVRTAAPVILPSGVEITVICAPEFLGTKLEAFWSRTLEAHIVAEVKSIAPYHCILPSISRDAIRPIANSVIAGPFQQCAFGHMGDTSFRPPVSG